MERGKGKEREMDRERERRMELELDVLGIGSTSIHSIAPFKNEKNGPGLNMNKKVFYNFAINYFLRNVNL